MKNITAFIEAVGGIHPFGRLFFPRSRQKDARACDVRRRGYLPTHHWPKAIRHAKAKGLDLTTDDLLAWQRRARRGTPLKRGTEEGVLRDKAREGRR